MSAIAEPITVADKAWEEKMARLRARKPLVRTVTLRDEDLDQAAEDAMVELGGAEIQARAKVEAKLKELKNDTERRTRVEKDMARDRLVVERKQLLSEAEAARDDGIIKMSFRNLAADVYQALQAEHPPTDEQRRRQQEYNVTTFGPVLVSACCTDPMTPHQAASLIGGEVHSVVDGKQVVETFEASLGFGEASMIFSTCVLVNEGSNALLGKE